MTRFLHASEVISKAVVERYSRRRWNCDIRRRGALFTTNPGGKDERQAVLIAGLGVCNVDSQMEDVAYVWLP